MAQDSLAAKLFALSGGERDLVRQLEGLQGSATPNRHLVEDLQHLLEATRATMQLVMVSYAGYGHPSAPSQGSCPRRRNLLGWPLERCSLMMPQSLVQCASHSLEYYAKTCRG